MSTTYVLNEKIKSRIDKNKFTARMAEILGNIPNAKFISVNFFDNVSGQIKELSNQDNFVFGLIKGETHRQIDIDSFFGNNNICLSVGQKKEIHDLVQLLLANEMNEYRTFQYITNNFPLFSFLKQKLLETRKGENIPQWEFIARNSPHLRAEFETYFKKIANYKEISDDLCKRAVSALVNHMTGKRFDNTISQQKKGWFPNGIFELPEQTNNIKPFPLFLIAFSFGFSLEEFDEMHARNEDVYDCLCYEDNMFRFALLYIRDRGEIAEFTDILGKNRKYFENSENKADAVQVSENIKSFFRNKKGSFKELVGSFMELLKKSGVVSSAVRMEILDGQRRITAAKNMRQLLNDVELNPIISYYSLLNSTADDIIRFKYKNDFTNAKKALSALFNNYRKLTDNCKPNEKEKILSLVCDNISAQSSRKINPTVRPVLKTRFTTNHIGKIKSGQTPVTRVDILKISYLRTFMDFINNNCNRFENKHEMTEAAKALTGQFEKTANAMLNECLFSPVHITFMPDGLIYIALSSAVSDKCIFEVFQACLPIETED